MDWNGTLLWTLIGSAVMFVGSIVVAWIAVVRMPSDYLVRIGEPQTPFRQHHPLLRASWVLVRNVVGAALLLVGLVMLVTPGQGVLLMFLGLTMVDFPRKHELIQSLLGRPAVIRTINKIRRRAGKPPLQEPDSPSPDLPSPDSPSPDSGDDV